ncbi:coenzyme F420-0:L-glutamate ligase [Microbacterium sp. gxy059]|uniref:coenzyme F420-0:L-glutamate ligase n=1 Tax=Microbacterium sp. gxy059 TaxID=2957199 RepID=UPI003D97D470
MGAEANEGKALEREVDGVAYQRIPIRTHVVMPGEKLEDVVTRYAASEVQEGDLLFITEKIVAIMQGRSYMMSEIQPRPLARFLSKYVTKTAYGIGLGIPETMEFALREVGTLRILFAAAVSAVTKLFGRSGDFYRIAGDKARAIDGPTPGTIPPYNDAVVLGPERPREVAAEVKKLVGCDVAVVDINDLGGNILGSTLDKTAERALLKVLQDNPLGQGHQSTPMGIIRSL